MAVMFRRAATTSKFLESSRRVVVDSIDGNDALQCERTPRYSQTFTFGAEFTLL